MSPFPEPSLTPPDELDAGCDHCGEAFDDSSLLSPCVMSEANDLAPQLCAQCCAHTDRWKLDECQCQEITYEYLTSPERAA